MLRPSTPNGVSAPGGQQVVYDRHDVDRLVPRLELRGRWRRCEGHPPGRPALKPDGGSDRADEERRHAQQKP
jgi:hypothetical protein